jgi:hypothetical protein
MAEISRRNFLKNARNGAAAVGIVAVAPTMLLTRAGAATKSKSTSAKAEATVRPVSSNETVVVHIPNPRSGEIHFMVGTREVVTHDRALVARLIRDIS